MDKQVEEGIRSLKDAQLVTMLDNAADYLPEAIAFVEQECAKRGCCPSARSSETMGDIETSEPESISTPLNNREGRKYGGIGRLPFILSTVCLGLASKSVDLLTPDSLLQGVVLWITSLGLTLMLFTARLRNIGANQWLSLLALVPLVNLYLAFRCWIEPEGYQDTKKLDRVGKTASLIIGYSLLLLAIVVVTWAVVDFVK